MGTTYPRFDMRSPRSPLGPTARHLFNGTSAILLLGVAAHAAMATVPTVGALALLALAGLGGSLVAEAGSRAHPRWWAVRPDAPGARLSARVASGAAARASAGRDAAARRRGSPRGRP